MLTWDEEVLSNNTHIKATEQDVTLANVLQQATQGANTPLPMKRITAADKRIINEQTDVKQLVPFKYKWA